MDEEGIAEDIYVHMIRITRQVHYTYIYIYIYTYIYDVADVPESAAWVGEGIGWIEPGSWRY